MAYYRYDEITAIDDSHIIICVMCNVDVRKLTWIKEESGGFK